MNRTLLIIATLLLVAGTTQAQWQPVGFKKWQADDTTFCKNIGGEFINYEKTPGVWAKIKNHWLMSGDTATALEDVLQTRVLPNGKSRITLTYGGNEYVIEQRLVRMIWLKKSTKQWVDIFDQPNWGAPSIDSNIVLWRHPFPGIDYRIKKTNAAIHHGVFFKPAFLDSAVILYNQRADSLDLALGNVMQYTLSANIDDADSALGDLDGRRFKHLGEIAFGLHKSVVHYPGSDSLPDIRVHQRWAKVGGKIYCIEFVDMSVLKDLHLSYPSATIWHNASPHTIDGTTNVEDAWLSEYYVDYNYGGSDYLYVEQAASEKSGLTRVNNVSSELGVGATITACTLAVYCITHVDDGNVGAFRIFKPWVEGDEDGVDDDDGDVTYNDWASDTYEWGTAGCNSVNDAGTDNSTDGGGGDRKETAEDEVNVTGTGWQFWDISTTLAQAWYAGTANENGVLLWHGASGTENTFTSTESGFNEPYWKFYYTSGEPPTGRRARVTKLLGRKP